MNTKTPTALSRWSCQKKSLPPVEQIKYIHIYDFDNTIFTSPLPNKQLWNTSTYGSLQAEEFLYHGGWWHNPRILAATGEGAVIEEPRAWQGCWNETIVDLARLSMDDASTLNILLTGRREGDFAELIGRMIASKGLQFDIVALRPAAGPNGEIFGSTMLFKQALLKDIVFTYSAAQELRIYEDRPKHVKGFRDFFNDLNKDLMEMLPYSDVSVRQPITAEVIAVADLEGTMDPVSEVAEVQQMVNVHNQAVIDGVAPVGSRPYKIKRSVFYTGYLISTPDIEKLKTLIKLPPNSPEHEIKYLANNILITPRPAPRSILDKVGGMGAKMSWKVVGVACLEDRIWAARVAPLHPGAKFFTDNQTPFVVLATKRQSKPFDANYIRNWQPVPESQAFEIETTVGEKVLLRIEQEYQAEDEYEASFPNARNARKHPREQDFPALGAERGAEKMHTRPQQRSNHQGGGYGGGTWQGNRGGNAGGIGFAAHRGGAGSNRGGGGRGGGGGQGGGFRGRRGGGGGQRGGRGRGGYRSLDDNVGQGYTAGSMQY